MGDEVVESGGERRDAIGGGFGDHLVGHVGAREWKVDDKERRRRKRGRGREEEEEEERQRKKRREVKLIWCAE